MTPENELQRALTNRVADVHATGDLPAIHRRASRRANGRRAMAVSLAAILVVGAGVTGFAFGRNANQTTDAVAPLDDAPADEAPVVASTVPATMAPSDSDDLPLPPPPPGFPSTGAEVAADDATRGLGSYGYGWSYSWGEPGILLTSRTTESGYTIRAMRSPWPASDYYWDGIAPTSSWRPAPWCNPTGEVRIGLAGPGLIDVGSGSWFDEPYGGLSVTGIQLGLSDGQPVLVVVAQVGADVQAATATAGAVSDSASPENGVVVLALPGEIDPSTVDLRLDRATGSGSVKAADLAGGASFDYEEHCSPPPPPLPPPGEQPVDVALAEDAVHATVAAVYAFGTDPEARLAYVDDTTGLADAFAAVAEGPFADAASTAQHTVTEVVFTSPTEAWFRYRIETSMGDFSGRYGRAVLVDGMWKVTRDTVCQDLSLGGGPCVPEGGPIMPPGAENWYEQFYGKDGDTEAIEWIEHADPTDEEG